MKKLFISLTLLAGLISTNSLAATEDECDSNDTSNLMMKICVAADYQKADEKLNTIYKQMASSLKKENSEMSKEILSRLVKAQKAWVGFRDAECDLQATEMLGGTGEGLVALACLKDLTEKRVEELKNYKESFAGERY